LMYSCRCLYECWSLVTHIFVEVGVFLCVLFEFGMKKRFKKWWSTILPI